MNDTLHITSGDSPAGSIAKAGIPGEILVWRDILYDGPIRRPGWPDEKTLEGRASLLERSTGGGLSEERILSMLEKQYQKLASAADGRLVLLWFDSCLFDMAMLAHILACLRQRGIRGAELICVDVFPGIAPFDGLGQLTHDQLAPFYGQRRPVTDAQSSFAETVDEAFAAQDPKLVGELSRLTDAPLPWVPAAAARWLEELPDADGLGRLERLALDAVRSGLESPIDIFKHAAANDSHPQFWGDTTLWRKINTLADRTPPLVKITGPESRLPQWKSDHDLKEFKITATVRS